MCPGVPQSAQDLCHPSVSREAEALCADLPNLKEGRHCLTHLHSPTAKEQESSVRTQVICLIIETEGEIAMCGKTTEPGYVTTPCCNPVRCAWEPLLLLSTEETPSKGTQGQQRNCEHWHRNFATQRPKLKPTTAQSNRSRLPHHTGYARTHTPSILAEVHLSLLQARARPMTLGPPVLQLPGLSRAAKTLLPAPPVVTHLGAAGSSGCSLGSGAAAADEGPGPWVLAWPGYRW